MFLFAFCARDVCSRCVHACVCRSSVRTTTLRRSVELDSVQSASLFIVLYTHSRTPHSLFTYRSFFNS